MSVNEYIAERKALWIVLSEIYLDTEMQPYEFKAIAKHIYESPFSFEEVRKIDKTAVFPVLHQNAFSVAGVWSGFDTEWLVTSVLKRKKRRNLLSRGYYDFVYFCMRGTFKETWQEIEVNHDAFRNLD